MPTRGCLMNLRHILRYLRCRRGGHVGDPHGVLVIRVGPDHRVIATYTCIRCGGEMIW